MAIELEKNFKPQELEGRIYEHWENSGAFAPRVDKSKKPFTIVMPPPNITGQLHMGHAMDAVMQDSLIRYHRMKGDPTLWLPGTDHASIATEVKIVEQMAAEGLTKHDLGRDGFLERAWAWKKEYGGRITRQLRRMGASCDWSRERFTMDEGCSKAVKDVFVKLYQDGLIYRGYRIINWCPVCQTTISDAEVEYEEQASHLWHIRYPGADGSEGVVVATTRPETMLGDTGVAVHPDDPRYQHLIGKTVVLPIVNREIPVVADEYVDMTFGTGAVKMTPAHDPNDFEVAKRHNLEVLCVLNNDGTMNKNAGERFSGMTALDCRSAVVETLEALGLMVKIENYTHNVGTCYRCHATVEPMPGMQWFVRMQPLAEPAIQAVREGKTRFLPERFSKTYYNWMENIRDWCISRQLWWGHRIPAWYCDDCDGVTVSAETPSVCAKCGGTHLKQDPDVLDTWFSSALWPFSTLGWPDQTDDLAYFYPTSTLVTGYDIIFFWVARMIFSGIRQMGQPPFDTVLMHGLVRDAQGRKMSKSLGNGIDPLEIIDQYGADALRFSLVMGVSPGNDTRYSNDKLEAARNFTNKIWNAARFALMNMDAPEALEGKPLEPADQWILTRCADAVQCVAAHMEDGDLGLAAQRIYDFAWSELCDWYIELAKSGLTGTDETRKATVRAVLQRALTCLCQMAHPFMPFITEEIYAHLPGLEGQSCMLSAWPCTEGMTFSQEAAGMEKVMDMIRVIRNLRAEMNVQPGMRARLMVRPAAGSEALLTGAEAHLKRLAGISALTLVSAAPEEKTVGAVCVLGELMIPLGDLVDMDKERARLEKERANLENELRRADAKLQNEGFLAKAPAALVDKEKQKRAENAAKLDALTQRIATLG